MRKCRRDLVMQAFKKLDRTNTGEVTIDDLKVSTIDNILAHKIMKEKFWSENTILRLSKIA